jgi:hypothetical protein
MDVLRRPMEQGAVPICGTCNVEMAWTRSTLVAAEQAISHMFICPKCYSIGETKTPVKAPE